MARGFHRLHVFASKALGTFAKPMLRNVWPWILGQTLQRQFREKPANSLLVGLHHVLIIAPHPDDEFYGCPDLLLSLSESGVKVTLAMITDGPREPAGSAISRVNMSLNAARLNGWDFTAMGWPVYFSRDPSYEMVEALTEFPLSYLAGDHRVDLIVLPIWCDYHPDHRAVTEAVLDALAKLPDSLDCPDLIFYWTFSAPTRIPEYAQVIRTSSNRWTETKHEWMLEYGAVVSPDAVERNQLIKESVSKACWGEVGYETVFWVSGSHIRQACRRARGSRPSCVKLNGSRVIVPNTVIYVLKTAFCRLIDRRT